MVTGAAGFIGFHIAKRLLERGDDVVGLDNINEYYDINLKYARLKECGIEQENIEYGKIVQSSKYPNYCFTKLALEHKEQLEKLFEQYKFDMVCNLAAQAGVRYSIVNPEAYINSNIIGYANILEVCRHSQVKHLVYASSSSVYGLNESMPFSTHDNVDHPVSLYAASKKSNELMAHTYSYLFNLPTTGLRFFTVYGPWSRPDMALFLFTKAILEGSPIKIFNNGEMKRDFTYIDDIVEGTISVLDNPPSGDLKWSGKTPDPHSSKAPYKVYNIGNSKPVQLMDFISEIEYNLGIKAKKDFLPLQAGDIPDTWASVKDLSEDFNYKPQKTIKFGVKEFVKWYREFYS